VTGGQIQRRELYTNGTILAKQITASLLITSRTAAFANRADIMERLCPLFVTSPARRLPESELFGELAESRDGALVWLARIAAEALARSAMAPERLPGRFVDWARVVWALDPQSGPSALEAMARAQQLAITDPDPLAAKVVEYVREHRALDGIPKAIVETIDHYHELEYLGGGKATRGGCASWPRGSCPGRASTSPRARRGMIGSDCSRGRPRQLKLGCVRYSGLGSGSFSVQADQET
jgi:hypothetical protein